MAAAQKEEEFLEDEDVFRRNAFLIICEMMEMENMTEEDNSALVEEVLHSIFFLGEISFPPFTPEMIFVDDPDVYDSLIEQYPRSFQLYSSQLPRRSPFSCVLDMVVHLIGEDEEERIKAKLKEITQSLRERTRSKILFSTTICISRTNTPNSVRHYGVSMSTFWPRSGKIMVAASCVSKWDDYVAGAVMTYHPDKTKKKYFDGTICLPKDVKCDAFNIQSGNQIKPCKSCGNLFGLDEPEGREWSYGNCAEVESISKLLENEEQVKQQAKPKSATWTDENKRRAIDYILNNLRRCFLKNANFRWDGNFFTPQ